MSVKPKSASADAHEPSVAPANPMLSLSVAPVAFAAAGALSTLGWAAFWAGAAAEMTRASLATFGMPTSAWRSADAAASSAARSVKPQLTAIEGGAGKAAAKPAASNGADVLPFPASTIVTPVAEAADVEIPVAEAASEEPAAEALTAETPVVAEPLTEAPAANDAVSTPEGRADAEASETAKTDPVETASAPVASAPVEATVAEPVVEELTALDPVVEPAPVDATAGNEPVAGVDQTPAAEPVAAAPADQPVVAEVEAAAPADTPEAAVVAEETPPATASTRPKGIYAPRGGVADNLKQISGIGPKIEKVLNELGFFHFEQIAAWTTAEMEWVDGYLNFKGRVARDRWQAQADALATGGAAEYLKRFGKEPR